MVSNSVFATMLTIAGTQIKTVEYCSSHYTHGTGQVRSNSFVQSPWQLREFKTDINSQGKVVFVADTVKSNPIARLFANEGIEPQRLEII
jgi:hypothetical protein